VSVAKSVWTSEAGKFARVENLTAGAQSREGILTEALEWESAWEAADPSFTPATGDTLAAFKTQREGSLTTLRAYQDARSDERAAAGDLRELGEALDDACVAWYLAATAVFPEGTAEGDMIRGTIPTTYSPPPAPPAPPEPPLPPPGP